MAYNRQGYSMATTKQKETIGLIDADILAYKCSAVNEIRVTWNEGEEPSQYPKDIELAYKAMDTQIGKWMEQLKLTSVVICLTDKNNFRKKILQSYKENRRGLIKPLQLQALKDYLSDNYESYIRPDLEADDIMGILSTHPTLYPGEKIIISADKDLTQIPGMYFNPDKDTKARLITKEEGDYFHYMQTLQGDPADGYKGAPGIGPKKATFILANEAGTPWTRIVSAFETKGLTEEDALVQAQVARICQYENYDYHKAKVIPWQPEAN